MSAQPKAGFDFSFGLAATLGQLGASMGRVADGTDAIHKWLTENTRVDPVPFPIAASVNSGAAAPTYLVIPLIGSGNLTGPPGGTRWSVGRIAVWGTDPYTAIAGAQISLHKGGATPPSGPSPINTGLVAISGAAGTFPWYATFARHAISVHSTEDIFVVVKSAGNNQLVTVEIEVIQFSERRFISP
jgi:hypothetical protein